MYTLPRFVAYYDVPHFGSRDEYVGSHSVVMATAETEAWINRTIDNVCESQGYDPDFCYNIRVVDNAPRSRWSAEISEYWNRIKEDESKLPF